MTDHRHLETCASTNDVARAWAADPADPAPDFAAVTAGAQTAGRGRQGRRWDADPGANVILSIVARPSAGLDGAWAIGFAASLAVAEALDGVGARALVKWPNDVLLDACKVAGILVETTLVPPCGEPVAVVGIGVNANQADFPEAERYLYPPTSLRISLGRDIDVPALAAAVVERFRHWETLRRAEGAAAVLPAWRARMAVGAAVRAGASTGRLQDVLDDGRALVALTDGTLARWTSVDSA